MKRKYESIKNKVKEMELALEHTNYADTNDLYELIYCRQRLEYMLKDKHISSDIRNDIEALTSHIDSVAIKVNTEEIKGHKLKVRYDSTTAYDAPKSLAGYFIDKLIKFAVLGLISIATSPYVLHTKNEVIAVFNMMVLILLVFGIFNVSADALYLFIPGTRKICARMVTKVIKSYVGYVESIRCSEAVDLVAEAHSKVDELKSFVDRLSNSQVSISDKHHERTFGKSRDKLTNQLSDILNKLDSNDFIEQLKGLADGQIVYDNTFVHR